MGLELEKDVGSRGLTDEGIIHIPGLQSRWVQMANGARAHYVTSGETGPAVILLHGSIEGSSGTAGWRFMCNFLGANGFRVFAPDRPGFGKSDTSKVQYLDVGPKAQVDFVTMFADALCLDEFHLGGNSGGCVLAYQYVLHNPERVLSIAYIAGNLGDVSEAPRVLTSEGKFSPNPSYVRPLYEQDDASMKAIMESIIYEPKAIWPELITMRTNDANHQRRGRVAAGLPPFQLVMQDPNPNRAQVFSSKGRLDKMTIPMIYLYGLQDVAFPVENGFNQEDSVPNIQFFYPDECGHQGQTDQPDMFNQVFLEFFRDSKITWETAQWAGVSRRREINPALVAEPAGGFPSVVREAYVDHPTLVAALKA